MVAKSILKHALKNAVEHGEPNAKAIIGSVLAAEPSLRGDVKAVAEGVRGAMQEIAGWSAEKRRKELLKMWPDALKKRERAAKEALGPLPNSNGKVVMRFAPNPNGPPTLGSSRGIVINGEYCKRYNGKLICRFDDTDPSLKKPLKEAYDWYLEDMEWLGYPPDKVVYASDRIPKYYKVAEELIMKRHAYVCTCPAEKFRKLKAEGKECPCRSQGNHEAMGLWKKMLNGGFGEGEAVLRIKTDMRHKDPAIRDWVAFRIRHGEHTRAGKKYIVWPMLDFEGAVEDHLLGTTHIIRGKDLRDSTERQKYIYRYMGWEYPVTLYWGRVAVHEFGKLSTSGISKGISEGKYGGWDDPRLPTIRALRRRGFQAEAIVKFWMGLGLSEKDVRASMATIEAFNKKLVDPKARRYFFVPKPKKIVVKGIPPTRVRLRYHPQADMGEREYFFKGEQEFYVPEAPDEFRLKDAFNVRKEGGGYTYAGKGLSGLPKLQWVSEPIEAELVMPGKTVKGVAERYLLEAKKGWVVQLERVGYARIDSVGNDKATLWLAHR